MLQVTVEQAPLSRFSALGPPKATETIVDADVQNGRILSYRQHVLTELRADTTHANDTPNDQVHRVVD